MKKLLKKENGMFAVVSIALVLFSSHAGGGFATGNQANTYFVGLGWAGILSAILSMLLLTAMLREAMTMYNERGLKSYKELFENLYHPFDKLEIVFELFFYIMVIMVVATTISGSASALKEYFSINYMTAVVTVGLLILLLTMFGADFVRTVGTYMGLVILLTSLAIYTVGSFQGEGFVSVLKDSFFTTKFNNIPEAVKNGFIYAGFQCVQIPAMIVCGGVLKNRREVALSMRISSFINILALGFSVVMLLSWRSYYTGVDGGMTLPTLTVIQKMGYSWVSAFYVLSLILCLISSGVTITFGFVSRFENLKLLENVEDLKTRRAFISAFIISLSVFISMAGLTNIIKYGYGYCGYIAIFFIVIPFLTIGAYKNRSYGRDTLLLNGVVKEID